LLEKKNKPFSQVRPLYPLRHSQWNFAPNLIEHCPPFKHGSGKQLESISFLFYW